MTQRAYDIAIVGGGPAGCAAGLSLRAHAPDLRVVLFEATGWESPRVGETLPPPARRLLEHLGLWQDFRCQGHREAHGTAAAWGNPEPLERPYLFATQGSGWHLDRAAFDARLATEAGRRGVTVVCRTRLRRAERTGETWCLHAGGAAADEPWTARFLIDATGAAAVFARRCGARFVVHDRLTGFARRFAEEEPGDPGVLVEAFADGWWYTAGLPGGHRIAVCLTDADVARRLRLADPAGWDRCLAATDGIRQLLRGARPQGAVAVRATPSRRLDPVTGGGEGGWLAVGDAASLFDPLSSQGILKGLRSGIFAAYAAGDFLMRGDTGGLARYARYVQGEFESYRRVRARYYAQEQRWPESEFWRRRR